MKIIKDKVARLSFVVLLIVLTAAMFYTPVAEAEPVGFSSEYQYGGVVADQVLKVVDGDTIYVTVDAWPPLFGTVAKIRLRGIDTPEIRGKCVAERKAAIEARDFVGSVLRKAKLVVLTNMSQGTFFRVVADVIVDGVNLNDLLVRKNMARVYRQSVGRLPWC